MLKSEQMEYELGKLQKQLKSHAPDSHKYAFIMKDIIELRKQIAKQKHFEWLAK